MNQILIAIAMNLKLLPLSACAELTVTYRDRRQDVCHIHRGADADLYFVYDINYVWDFYGTCKHKHLLPKKQSIVNPE